MSSFLTTSSLSSSTNQTLGTSNNNNTENVFDVWEGKLYLAQPNEVVCKMCYEHFYSYTDVEVVAHEWDLLINNYDLVNDNRLFINKMKRRVAGSSFKLYHLPDGAETRRFDCVVIPYPSSYSIPDAQKEKLIKVFGGELIYDIEQYIVDHYVGDQPPASTFILPTKSADCSFVACVALTRDMISLAKDWAYNAFRAVLVAIRAHNKTNDVKIKEILCPIFSVPQELVKPEMKPSVSPAKVIQQMEICYKYWDWSNNWPRSFTQENIEEISKAVHDPPAYGPTQLETKIKKLLLHGKLEKRGLIWESELDVLMQILGEAIKSEATLAELVAELLITLLKKSCYSVFELSNNDISAGISAEACEYVLKLNRMGKVCIHTEIDMSQIKIQQTLGSGGSAEVFIGIWDGFPVAVKKFIGVRPVEFQNELSILSLLHHPKLVKCIGGSAKYDTPILVAECMDGSLWDVLHHAALTLNFQQKMIIAVDIAEAMCFLHQRGIIHRDLKSGNILVKFTNPISSKLSDFGLSRIIDHQTKMTGNIGTVAWMAPEVLQNKKYGEKADCYSFGIILWEMITSALPFREVPPLKLPKKVINGLRPPISKERFADVPKWYVDLIQKCWYPNPSRRPTFETILKTLKRYGGSNGRGSPTRFSTVSGKRFTSRFTGVAGLYDPNVMGIGILQ